MSFFYHGTVVGGLTELRPFASPFSNLKTACVYLSSNKALASIYIWNKPFKWMTFHIREDGMPIYTEAFPGSLKEFYDGLSGFIYTCEGEFDMNNATGIKYAAISEEPVPVLDCDIVANAYDRILLYEATGEMVIRRFEQLTQGEHDSNRKMIMNGIKHLNLLEGTHPLSPFVKEKYPELWEVAIAEVVNTVPIH